MTSSESHLDNSKWWKHMCGRKSYFTATIEFGC